MANKQTFTLQFDASLNVSQMKSALNSVQSELSKLKLPANITKGLQDTFQKLSSELKNFENISSGSTGSKNDLTKLENSVNKILNLWDKLRSSVQNLGGVSGSQLEKLFPESVANNIRLARDAFKGYDKAVQDATKDLNEANKQVNDIQAKMDKIQSKEVVPSEKFNQLKNDIKAANTEIEKLMQDEAAALQKVEEKRASLKDPDKRPGKILPGLEEELRKIQQQLDDTKKKRDELTRQKDNSITESAQSKALEEQNQKYQDALLKVQELKQALETLQSVGEGGGAQQLIQTISKITGVDISQFTNGVDSAREAFANYIRTVASGTTGSLSQFGRVMDQNREAISHTSEEVRRATVDQQRYDERMRDVQALKSRIQYFFGLSNAINLVKRAIRGAFDTIKELDKAMTETAVVTDFSVSDMWAQLPEYTKRANELGVTTLAAYKAATLYYQQGLKTNEVNALSVETLKMARIAGLDAAEATDRMTNALRGFNMELNTANAQRVDDVYSELAANTASNVDEISTAMTKVASLAHNANMEFETTAAFLAQIIETTRESAETAGTALKTVVARFSEVKKLVDEGTLRGQDEEGQVIDVNKVSAALRTAGIDMNKYFLGEVGLDDIFMELASKWDSLTALQQRYIATQAAGSRQQSRFIALMSDYARTQELVGKAYNANGAAARQFEKTQESLESKLARLKNAWNEFLMGLTNNVVVKGAVDLLTDLLNVINKLTSAFGDSIGTLAKWGVVAASIFGGKALLSTGGLIDKALMGLLGGTGIGDALTNAGIIGGTRAGQNQVQGPPTASGQMPRRATVFGNIGSLGKKGWGLASGLGSKVGSLFGADLTGTAAGLAGIGTALGAVAVAVGLVVAGYQVWLHFSLDGQIKQAQKVAEVMGDVATSTQNTANSYKKALEDIKQYNETYNEAFSAEDRSNAIQSRNEYILGLLEENESYAQYLQSTFKDNELILTLDEEALANAANLAAEAAVKAAIGAQFANATSAGLNAKKLERQLSGINLEAGTRTYQSAEGGDIVEYLTQDERIKYTQLANELAKAQQQMQAQAKNAFSQLIDVDEVGDDVANLMSQALAQGFDNTKVTDTSWWWLTSRSTWQDRYRNAYGAEADASWGTQDIARAVRQYENNQSQRESVNQLTNLVNGPNGSGITKLLSGYIGEAFSQSLTRINPEDEAQIYGELFGLDVKDIDGLAKNISDLASALGINSDELRNLIQENIKAQKKAQAKTLENSASSILSIYGQGGLAGQNNTDTIADQISKIWSLESFEDQKIVDNLLNQFKDTNIGSVISENIANAISDGTLDQEFANWAAALDFSDPITSYASLQSQAESTNQYIKDTANAILNNKESIQQFSNSAQVNYFLLSESFESLEEDLQKFIDENGEISSSNIKELAQANGTLNQLLKNGAITAKGLATALNGIQNGTINVTNLNDAIIAALNSMDDLDGIVKDTIDDLNSFDSGFDENDITGFIDKVYKNATENIGKGAWGNNQMRNYMQYIFGSFDEQYTPDMGDYGQAYKTWLTQQTAWLEANKENMFSAWSDFAATLDNGMLDVAEIYERDGEIIINANGMTTEQLIQAMVNTGQVTEQQARMMIGDFKNYSADFRHELDAADLPGAIQAWYDALPEINGQKIYDESDLETLKTLFDASDTAIADAIAGLEQSAGELRAIKWTNEAGERTAESIQNALQEIGTKLQTEDGLFDYNAIRQAYNNLGIPELFESDFQTILGESRDFTANFFGEQTSIHIEEGQTAGEAYAQAYQQAVNEQLASGIGEAVVKALADNDIKLTADADTTSATEKITTLGELANSVAGTYSLSFPVADTSAAVGQINALTKAIQNYNAAIAGSTGGGASGNTGATGILGGTAAGGIVQSNASGSANNKVAPGISLTGEEDPEIVWNKEKGYAYITGTNGPEFQTLQPGDRVFNAQETKAILRRSTISHGKIVPSFARGYSDTIKPGMGGFGSDSDSDKYQKQSTWRNELDWLYDLMEDIAEYERQQNIIQARNELALEDIASSGRDLYKLTREELTNLETQLDGQQAAQLKRLQQMGELQTQVNAAGYGRYMQWNQQDQTLEIDWDAIEAIQDKETYDEVVDWLNRMESVQDQIDDAEDAMWDIKKQIQELQQRYLQKYLDFQNRVLDAIVKQYQDQIDKLTELNNDVNDTNASILDSIQREIDLERQIRDNTDVESDIANLEARLAYLQRDTTGANAAEIRSLQEQLNEARTSYGDTLIDQAVDRLAQSNEDAAAQREKQIELMQAQLDYWQESGGLWSEVEQLISTGFNGNGSLIRGSDLEKVLQNAENYEAMSQAQRDNWANELILETNQVGAHILELADGMNVNAEQIRALLTNLTGRLGGTPEHSYTAEKAEEKYATGGLNTYTGLARLDGTPSAPEYVLNPEQTNAFLRLADVLPSIMGGDSIGGTTYGGDIYLNLDMHVDEIASDYDVDRIADRVKDILYDASSYRNVNTLNFIR